MDKRQSENVLQSTLETALDYKVEQSQVTRDLTASGSDRQGALLRKRHKDRTLWACNGLTCLALLAEFQPYTLLYFAHSSGRYPGCSARQGSLRRVPTVEYQSRSP